MKKRNLKSLALNKTSVSNLTGGGETVDTGTLTGPTVTVPNSNFIGCWSDGVNSCLSEYRTACEQTMEETCGIECESIQNPF
ncbi:hypothetical protein H2O64_01345 [Kordia sp. YSTF-M3]|uniref:Bacteriocin n=1 Tax=Kordia aestuariivivens TaxID=2759037 RepID=A0ABR7Q407_9FLAO|nr:hypothetical protein [Kordia aestuariivivens]MBC8753295.1 hypothetical protein [Kordia aestuariivivens]